MSWLETEITNFKGMNRSVGTSKEEAYTIDNLDPRGRVGELTNAPGFTETYTAPSHANVSPPLGSYRAIETIFMSQFDKDDEREVTIVAQSCTVDPIALSGNVSKDVQVISVRPYWNGASWVDAWDWLNKIVLTDILTVSGTHITIRGHNLESVGWVIENTYKNEFATIIDEFIEVGQDAIYNITKDNWSVNDNIIIYKNYIPMKYMEGMHSAVAKDYSSHHILNGLRMACGGYADRLGLSIDYRARVWDIKDATVKASTNVNGLMLDPYFPLDENGIYGIESSFEPITNMDIEYTPENTDLFNGGREISYYFVLVANLDKYNSFKVAENVLEFDNTTDGNLTRVYATPKVKFSEMNKRITSFDLFIAEGLNGERVSDYTLAKNFNLLKYEDFKSVVPKFANKETWDSYIDVANGYLRFVEDYRRYDASGNEIPVDSVDGRGATLFYSEYKNGKETELETSLGYYPTMNYVKSWDVATTSQGRTHLLNAYIDQRYENLIFISHFSGAGASMVDVITTGGWVALESRDGNNVMGLEILPNTDILALKQSSKQMVDTLSGAVRDLNMGKGCVARRSVINFGGKICWANEYGIVSSDGLNDVIITDKIKELYEAITNKPDIISAREEKGTSYKFTANFGSNGGIGTMLYLDNFGWAKTYEIPFVASYTTNKDGNAVTLDQYGKVWTLDYTKIPGTTTLPVQFIWQSTPMDISLLGESIKDTNRLILGRLWIDYNFSADCTFSYRIDGGDWETTTIPSSQTHFSWRLAPGVVGRTIEVKVSGHYDDTWDKLRIKAIGLLWKPHIVGRFG